MFEKFREYLALRSFNKTYRIVEINDFFIAQIKEGEWAGIDRGEDTDANYANITWNSHSSQLSNCGFKTYQEANERLLKYVEYMKKKTPKVHKVTIEPKAWRILKDKNNVL